MMPAHYKIDKARRLVSSVATGTFTDDDLRGHTRGLAADPDFDPSFRQIFDLRGITDLDLTGPQMRERARENPWKEGSRRAFVCSREVVYGMARMYQLLTDDGPDEIRVFRKMSEALAWLGLDTIE
jgi:hypothetical protein